MKKFNCKRYPWGSYNVLQNNGRQKVAIFGKSWRMNPPVCLSKLRSNYLAEVLLTTINDK